MWCCDAVQNVASGAGQQLESATGQWGGNADPETGDPYINVDDPDFEVLRQCVAVSNAARFNSTALPVAARSAGTPLPTHTPSRPLQGEAGAAE